MPAYASGRPASPPIAASTKPSVSNSARQPEGAGSERHADRDIALPRDGARELQIRHVGAGHRQHESHRAQQQQHAHTQFAGDLFAQRTGIPLEAAIEFRMLRRKR